MVPVPAEHIEIRRKESRLMHNSFREPEEIKKYNQRNNPRNNPLNHRKRAEKRLQKQLSGKLDAPVGPREIAEVGLEDLLLGAEVKVHKRQRLVEEAQQLMVLEEEGIEVPQQEKDQVAMTQLTEGEQKAPPVRRTEERYYVGGPVPIEKTLMRKILERAEIKTVSKNTV